MIKRSGLFAVTLILIIGVCGLVMVVGGAKLFTGLINNSQAMGDVTNNFMAALRDQNLDDAYQMFSAELQNRQSRVDFKEALTGNTIKDWKFTHFSIKDTVGYVEGTATDGDGNHYVAFQLINYDDKWAISGYNLGTLGWIGTVGDPTE